jgi:hypothetical protein
MEPITAAWFTTGMSLTVQVFARDPDGKDSSLGDSCAAGFESWRTEVWASPAVRTLGAEFFPQLASSDLCIEPGQVTRFLGECTMLREHLDTIVAGVDLTSQRGIAVDLAAGRVIDTHSSPTAIWQSISQRLANIENAARRALETGGGVIIW